MTVTFFNFADDFTAIAIAYPAQLRKRYTIVGLIELHALRASFLAAFLETRECCTLLEEILVAALQIFERLLQRL